MYVIPPFWNWNNMQVHVARLDVFDVKLQAHGLLALILPHFANAHHCGDPNARFLTYIDGFDLVEVAGGFEGNTHEETWPQWRRWCEGYRGKETQREAKLNALRPLTGLSVEMVFHMLAVNASNILFVYTLHLW